MATNTENHINYILEIDKQHLNYLGQIRHWNNLKIAKDGNEYWIKDITEIQLNSLEIKSIPFVRIYKLVQQKLFPLESLLPTKKIPSSLLWTPLEKGLPLTLPSYNFNFFGLEQVVSTQIIPSEHEYEAVALLVPIKDLSAYINTAPSIRFKSLNWVIIEDNALILGTPLLPIQGKTFWKRGDALLPTGYDFEFHLLSELINNQINPENKYWSLWNEQSDYFLIDKTLFQPLSLSSFRLSISQKV
jgi:hypothetical protein